MAAGENFGNCRSCPLFRRCDQFAMVTDLDGSLRRSSRRSAACLRRRSTARLEFRKSTVVITAPAGFSAAGVYAGIKPKTHAWPLDVMLMTADHPVSAAAVVYHEQDDRRPCHRLAGQSREIRRTRACYRLQQRLRERMHGTRGHAGGAFDRRISSRAKSGADPRKSWSPRPGSSASISIWQKVTRRCHRCGGRVEPRWTPQRPAGHHDDRPVSQRSGGESGDRRRDRFMLAE